MIHLRAVLLVSLALAAASATRAAEAPPAVALAALDPASVAAAPDAALLDATPDAAPPDTAPTDATLDAAPSGAAPDAASAAASPQAAPMRPRPRDADARCTPDRKLCISEARYIPDVCRTIEAAALQAKIDPNFFARLVWRESLFDAGAVSPAGALGIAQFIPETAKRRGLADPFNPAEALSVSAEYLADLAQDFGNIGLAAAAYNGGEARVEKYLAGKGGLPLETRAYVHAITGFTAEDWRDRPPGAVDLALAKGKPFRAACEAHAASRRPTDFRDAPVLKAWGVILASNRTRDGAERQVSRLRNRHDGLLAGEDVAYARGRLPGRPLRLYNAQVGRDSRAEADALCSRLRAAGASCMVLRN